MLELIGQDLFDQIETADAICITTNCSVDEYTNPMGGGCAGAAARMWPELPTIYGTILSFTPNVPCILGYVKKSNNEFVSIFSAEAKDAALGTHCAVIAYPTMYNIGEPADQQLVIRSANLLAEMADLFGFAKVVVPRPGSGIGGLDYNQEVKPFLSLVLDDRFVIIHKDGK